MHLQLGIVDFIYFLLTKFYLHFCFRTSNADKEMLTDGQTKWKLGNSRHLICLGKHPQKIKQKTVYLYILFVYCLNTLQLTLSDHSTSNIV